MSPGPSDRETAAESKRRQVSAAVLVGIARKSPVLAWTVAAVSGAGSALLVSFYVIWPGLDPKVGIMPQAVLPVAVLIAGSALACFIAIDRAIQIREMNVWLAAIQDRAALGPEGRP
ncbi:hypothetical protein [Microlunatus speluncae]|uniref:hypothetical protein n=1 Tax=Microlunatus speluncae TaxID=2594267 RepID=UPI001266694D|nr:hypothetical protein [Microlunatus speluncae]